MMRMDIWIPLGLIRERMCMHHPFVVMTVTAPAPRHHRLLVLVLCLCVTGCDKWQTVILPGPRCDKVRVRHNQVVCDYIPLITKYEVLP